MQLLDETLQDRFRAAQIIPGMLSSALVPRRALDVLTPKGLWIELSLIWLYLILLTIPPLHFSMASVDSTSAKPVSSRCEARSLVSTLSIMFACTLQEALRLHCLDIW
jgi:hypothetical protein